MTNIELRFFESAIQFFNKTKSTKIDREERRYLAATVILAGMCGNPSHLSATQVLAKNAVWLADELMKQLSETSPQ